MNIKEANLSYLASAVSATGLEVSGQKRNFFISKIHNWKLQSAASVVLFVSAACGGGEEAVATRSGNSQANPEPIKAELTAAATATSIPTIVVETPRPTATANPETSSICTSERALEVMPQPVRNYYNGLIHLNKENVFRDATTGGSLTEEEMRKGYLELIERAACFFDSNKLREDGRKFSWYWGTLSPLAAQYYATGRDRRISDLAETMVSFLSTTFPENFKTMRSAGGPIPEFMPKDSK